MKNIIQENMGNLEFSNLETAELLEMAEYFDSLEDLDYAEMAEREYAEYLDFLDNLEDAEHLKKHGTRKARPHGKPAIPRVQKKKHMTSLKGRAKLAAVGGGGNYAKPGTTSKAAPVFGTMAYIQKMMMESVGDLNITVIRETANIPSPLPYILFGLNGFNSSYISTIKEYLPPGVTMVATVATNGDVLQTFTSGLLIDVIRITLTGSLISYSEFLQSMNSNFFKTNYIRQEYPNDGNLLLAVSQPIRYGLLSALGMKNANNLLPRSRRLNGDYQTMIINLFMATQKITSDFSFVQAAIPVALYTIAWDVFMCERINLNNMQQ